MNTLMAKFKGMWKSRTMYFGLGIAMLGQAQASRTDVDMMLDSFLAVTHLEWVRPYVWPLVGFGVVWLRWLTTQPLDAK